MAIDAFNIMEGRIDWAAIPILVELYGVEDIEIFLAELAAIRGHNRTKGAN